MSLRHRAGQLSCSTVRLTGVLCIVGDGELILASDPTRGSRHDFPPVGQEGLRFFSSSNLNFLSDIYCLNLRFVFVVVLLIDENPLMRFCIK